MVVLNIYFETPQKKKKKEISDVDDGLLGKSCPLLFFSLCHWYSFLMTPMLAHCHGDHVVSG